MKGPEEAGGIRQCALTSLASSQLIAQLECPFPTPPSRSSSPPDPTDQLLLLKRYLAQGLFLLSYKHTFPLTRA